MSLVLEIALTAGLITVMGVLIYRALGATFKWLSRPQHLLGVLAIPLALLALVLKTWDEFLGVIAVAALVAILMWLLKKKDKEK